MLAYKYQTWVHQYKTALIMNRKKRENKRKKVLAAVALHEILKKERTYQPKRFWIDPLFHERHTHGFYHALYPVISLNEARFRNYFRMTATQFEQLLEMVGPIITKQTVIREPISAEERLSLTLRFLASGDSMTSMSYQYLIGLTTVTNIIDETCEAIWNCLREIVLKESIETDEWHRIAHDFENTWNFAHCIGAIDGKHVMIQCPNNAGSLYFNYKHWNSIVLLGICNANYIFTFVDIGAYGRRSDGGIFRDSVMGHLFEKKNMNLPESEPISPGGKSLPYILVGDEAFQLAEYLLRPYPGKDLNPERRIFNYRLSRARRTIENTFGILVSRWRILKRPIICNVKKTIKIVQAIVCLHNWLRIADIDENQYVPPSMVDQYTSDGEIPGSWRNLIEGSALHDIGKFGSNNSTRQAQAIRDEFCNYFYGEGAIPWQFNCL